MKGLRGWLTERNFSAGRNGGPVILLDEGCITRSVQAQNRDGSAVGFKDVGKAETNVHEYIFPEDSQVVNLK